MRILTYQNKEDLNILKSLSSHVDLENDDWKDWTSELFKMTVGTRCLGLALPQIGIPKRMIAIKKRATKEILIMINPEITHHSPGKMKYKEGCLSIPGLNVNTNRYKGVTVNFFLFTFRDL